ncbi:terpenoid cyclases/protein prenyltransferase alpha-alpha toroid [Lipomyces arxii]|uniref:terpenoid cyclases/protein prenyltransferase alpha-alpha toroid n=1 Tax=Lipomyces arxii TaxID=56418 RepID=UPI0034D01AF9
MFVVNRHAKYFQNSLRLLPYQYTPTDTSRLALAFFSISALDLINCLPNDDNGIDTLIKKEEVKQWIDWVYDANLVPTKDAFRCAPASAVSVSTVKSDTNPDPWNYDVGHTAGTYFALGILLILRDDLSRLDRPGMMKWLSKCQRQDGSFATGVLESKFNFDGLTHLFGERDLRFGYCSNAARWIIGGDILSKQGLAPDINIDTAKEYIRSCISYDGGIGMGSGTEGHAGLTYCAVGTLNLLEPNGLQNALSSDSVEMLLDWLLMHQVYSPPAPNDSESESDEEDEVQLPTPPAIYFGKHGDPAGFNGRVNKPADTCYSFWTGASLEMIPSRSADSITGSLGLTDVLGNVIFLLTQTQNSMIGGFAKAPGAMPDLMHAYLGIAALAMCADVVREHGGVDKFLKGSDMGKDYLESIMVLKPIDGPLCIAMSAKHHAEKLRKSWEK